MVTLYTRKDLSREFFAVFNGAGKVFEETRSTRNKVYRLNYINITMFSFLSSFQEVTLSFSTE